MDINEVIKRPEYSFLNEDERLGENTIILTYGGSIAYGLNGPTSDTDIRGILLPTKKDLLSPTCFISDKDKNNKHLIMGPSGFEQYLDKETDTTLYSLKKMIGLLYKCNPNTIEILGCKPEHYAVKTEGGKILLDNAEAFLSKKAYYTFASYSRAQFQKLKNALDNRSNNLVRQINLIDRINRMQTHLEESFPTYKRSMINMYITDLDGNIVLYKGELLKLDSVSAFCYEFSDEWSLATIDGTPIDTNNVKISLDIAFENIDPKDFSGIHNEIMAVVKNFNSHLGHRNNKKDDYHLNKHAMHLVRLYKMCKDILVNHRIITYREEDIDFLLSIKNGYYMREDGTYKPEFFHLVDELDNILTEMYEKTTLPDEPDKNVISNICMDVMETAKYLSQKEKDKYTKEVSTQKL